MTSRALSVRLSEQVTLSDTHFYADCGLHVQADDVLFVVSEAMICARSPIFVTRLAEARAVNRLAGVDRQHALLLKNITPQQLKHFFDYLWGDHRVYNDREEPDAEGLVDVLRLSVLFGVDSGKTFATHFLEFHGDLPETQRLMLSLEYGLHQWFKSCLVWLVRWPLSNWTPTEVELLDKVIFLKIMETQSQLHSRRCLRALDAPQLVMDCATSALCLSNWDAAWKRLASPILIGPYTEHDVYNEVRGALRESNSVCDSCLPGSLRLIDLESLAELDTIEAFATSMMRIYDVNS